MFRLHSTFLVELKNKKLVEEMIDDINDSSQIEAQLQMTDAAKKRGKVTGVQ